jgi:hypothetical protein
MEDGSFETGEAEVIVEGVAGFESAMMERSSDAARSGSYGYAITAGPGQGARVGVKGYVEKGDQVRFSFWARSPTGQASIRPEVLGGQRGQEKPSPFIDPVRDYAVGQEWTEIALEGDNANLEYLVLTLDIGPDTTLYIDDLTMKQHIFQMAHYPQGVGRTVGGIQVPAQPAGPVHIAVLIHIEDPPKIHISEEYFWEQTAIMRELAAVLHRHGGMLTIQPEEDWAIASETWHPGLLAELVADYGVVYSTHTHGPHCTDPKGRLRSHMDCSENKDTPGWDQTPNDRENPWVTDYVRNLRDLLAAASGTELTDHNGNWEFAEAGSLSEIPMLTWSAYKSWRTQHTYDVLINNPWRPVECNPDAQTDAFLSHDPGTEVIYIPGWGQNVARFLDRLQVRMAPLLSQFIRYADPDRVNTFYVVTHVGSFEPRDRDGYEDYFQYNTANGESIYSDAFRQDLRAWDDLLTDLIDPLVAEGYVTWTSLPEMGRLFVEWESQCALGE